MLTLGKMPLSLTKEKVGWKDDNLLINRFVMKLCVLRAYQLLQYSSYLRELGQE